MVNQFMVTSEVLTKEKHDGVYVLILGKSGEARYPCLDRWRASNLEQSHQENRSKLVQVPGNLQKLQCLLMGVPDKLGKQNHCRKEKSRSVASSVDRHSSRACDVEVQR